VRARDRVDVVIQIVEKRNEQPQTHHEGHEANQSSSGPGHALHLRGLSTWTELLAFPPLKDNKKKKQTKREDKKDVGRERRERKREREREREREESGYWLKCEEEYFS